MTTETKAIHVAPADPWRWAWENIGLIHKRINRHRDRAALETLERDDLTQECLIVAVKAIETYAPGRGASVQTWVSRLVHQHLTRVAAKAPVSRSECALPAHMESGTDPESALIAAESASERADRARARVESWARSVDAQTDLFDRVAMADLVRALFLVCDGTSDEDAAAQTGVPVDNIRLARNKWRL